MNFGKISLYMLCLFIPITGSAQIFNTDVIVKGSLCVGNSCSDTELFGSDTQRFREDNIRIHFQDESFFRNFASNDWRIVINDNQDGGDNYFIIEDDTGNTSPFRIDAGAGNNALRINSSGNVGIGTSTAETNLHIRDSDTPTIRLEQDGNTGFTEQSWDIAGNEFNFFIRDLTNSNALPFRIRAGAPNDAFYIENNGNVSIGDNANQEKLYVKGNVGSDGDVVFFREEVAGNGDFDRVLKLGYDLKQLLIQKVENDDLDNTVDIARVHQDAPENSLIIHESGAMSIGSDTENRKLYINGGLTVNGDIQALSDRRLKTDIMELPYGLDAVMNLAPKQYNFVSKGYEELKLPTKAQLGLIAQDVLEVIPELVTENIQAKDAEGETKKLMGVNYTALIPVLVKAIQEQEQQHTDKIADINDKIDDLSSKLNMLIVKTGNNTHNQNVSTNSPVVGSDEYTLMHSKANNDSKKVKNKSGTKKVQMMTDEMNGRTKKSSRSN